ncbi:MAG: type II toxin-antitoxin system VapC family toxin [Nitrospirae bacterium]|nr:type II toxin-antitoxin system VapC family toxin [Nitrospirota bacterium]
MKGIDTNVLVRYLVKDDKAQAEIASAYIREITESGGTCFINIIVLCELIWVLESAYEFHKNEIADVCDRILRTKQFEIEAKDIARRAVNDYRNGKADFADYIIGKINNLNGCDITATFDRALKKQDGFILLE